MKKLNFDNDKMKPDTVWVKNESAYEIADAELAKVYGLESRDYSQDELDASEHLQYALLAGALRRKDDEHGGD